MSGRAYERKFDWDEARRLRATGLSYAEIARRLGVSDSAVNRVCNPALMNATALRLSQFFVRKCHYCGGRAVHNPYSPNAHHVPRCRDCFNEQKATSVRDTELHCALCDTWKPDNDFPWSRAAALQRRGRHQTCRACCTRARQEYRERHKAPCACCGSPALPPNEKTTRGTSYPRCRDCYRARIEPMERAA